MAQHLRAIFADAPEGHLLEIRAIADGRKPEARLFSATHEGVERGAAWAAGRNRAGRNIYIGLNPRRPDTPTNRAASAENVVGAARWLVADLDNVTEAVARLRALPIAPRFIVITGTVPRVRAHAWWRLADEIPLAEWAALQLSLAEHLGADPNLADPARVVRLAGSVTWPKASKVARGYVSERTRAELWPDSPATVTAAALREMAGASPDAHEGADGDWVEDVDARPALPPPSLTRLRSALAHLDPEPRDTWLRTGAALKAYAAETGEDAESLFIAWSRGDLRHGGPRVPASFQGEDDCRSLLASLRREDGARVTVASIIHEAKRNGWRDPGEAAEGAPAPETYGDRTNGTRFAQMHRGCVLYVRAEKRWRAWDGVRWAPPDGREIALAKATADAVLHEAATAMAAKPDDTSARRNFALALNVHRSAPRIREMVAMAASEPGMAVADAAAFDAEPFLLGVPNGAVDLRTGRLLPPNPGRLVSRIAGAAFDPEAPAPRWERFLRDVFAGDVETVAFIQRAVGYSLTGDVREEVMFFAHGEGRNGKSAFANVLAGVFGDYATVVGADLLAKRASDGEAARLRLRLPGARLALANETGEGDTFHDARMKELVSRERIPARALYGEAFDFPPTHHLWVRGNHKPAVHDDGDGFWRRLILIPFSVKFPPGGPEDIDRQILAEEATGILAWAVRGAMLWQQRGLDVPAALRRATTEYRESADVLGEWFRASVARREGTKLPVQIAYESAKHFFRDAGLSPPSRPAFVRRLSRFGLVREREGKDRNFFPDHALRDDGEAFEEGAA